MSAQASVLMSWIGGSVANLAFFPRIWACFLVELRFFLRLAGCLFLGLFQLNFACFLGLFFADCFFSKFYGTFAVSIYC